MTSYDLEFTIPVDLNPAFTTPSASNATFKSYSNQVVTITTSSLTIPTLIIGLLTPLTTAPITTTLNIKHNNTRLFYGTQNITMTSLKTFSTLTVVQSNDIVYSPFTATVTMSGLAVGDSIQLTTTFPSYFYSSNQTACNNSTTSAVVCQSGGVLQVTSVPSNNLTVFSV